MLSLLRVPVILQGYMENGKLLYGVIGGESQKLLRDKVDQISLQS